MIAIPDFAAGAMENYGLVTYRESALLYDEQLSSASNKQQVMAIFCSSPFVSLTTSESVGFYLNVFQTKSPFVYLHVFFI